MSNKIPNSGELLKQLNKNIDKSHHQKLVEDIPNDKNQQYQQKNKINIHSENMSNNETQKKQQHIREQTLRAQMIQQKEEKKQLQKKTELQRRTQTQKQRKTSRSHIQRATQLQNKKNSFGQDFSNSQIKETDLQQDLHEIMACQIGNLISEPLAEVIESAMKQRQNAIYIAYTQNQIAYLQKLVDLQKKKEGNNILEIQNLLQSRKMKTFNKLQNGQLFIDRQRAIKSKSQIQDLQQLDIARLLKIKQGAIRSKLDLLHDKMFQFDSLGNQSKSQQKLLKYQEDKIQELTDPNNFSLNSEKTKIANDYVKHLKQEKLILLRKMRQRQQKKQKSELQRIAQLKQAEEMRNLAKKQQVSQKIRQSRKNRQKQHSQQVQKSKMVEQFLKNHRQSLPLYRKKDKQFRSRYEKSRQKQRQQKLKQIREKHKSLNMNEIKGHEQKYLQKKQKQQIKREQQFKMIINAKKASQNQKKYFKGYFHDKVKLLDQQQKLKFYSLRQSTKIKIERMTEFDQKIRKDHKPKVDLEKKEALQKVIQLDILKKKKVKKVYKQVTSENGEIKLQAYYQEIPEVNHYIQGNKFMEISKSLAKKTTKADTERNNQSQYLINEQTLEQMKTQISKAAAQDLLSPSRIISHQKDIWRLRSKQLNQMTQYITANSFDQIKKNLQQMDQKAKKRQELLKYKQSNAHQTMHQKGMLDQFYLESIKNKIKLLNE